MTLRTKPGSKLDSKLARAISRRKGSKTVETHADRRRSRFEDDYRSVCSDRFGKREGFGLRENATHVA